MKNTGMKLPAHFLNSIRDAKGFDEESFIQCHQSNERITSIRINPFKQSYINVEETQLVPWCTNAIYLKDRPSFTFDPLFHAGAYYVQEAGSMFIEFALRHSIDLSQTLSVLDLCAAPGGKSTHLNSLISQDSFLISNEVIKNRAEILSYNLSKWGTCNTAVTNADPSVFSKLEGIFDLLIADVPCSGSGLFRKQPEAVNEWSTENVASCSSRQKRILADALNCLKPGGTLIYSTCSYSTEEDECIVEWLINEFGMEFISLPVNKEWGIIETDFGYRFYPNLVKSEGFFCAVLRKTNGEQMTKRNKNKFIEAVSKKEIELLSKHVNIQPNHVVFKFENNYKLVNKNLFDFLNQFGSVLYFRKTGTTLGELKHNDFIPDHELALSIYNQPQLTFELSREDAISFLKKETLNVKSQKGIHLITYNKLGLGWAKVMDNRMNNYLPKEFRILSSEQD